MPESSKNPPSETSAPTSSFAPVEITGNWFWKDGKRFLIKGVHYNPRKHALGRGEESYIDPLSDDWLPELRKDIPYFHKLGINTLSVEHSDTAKNPAQALQLLRDEGIHVLLILLTDLRALKSRTGTEFDDPADPVDLQRIYSKKLALKTLAIINQTADNENLLGYSMHAGIIGTKGTTRIASLLRAAVRDAKHYLTLRGGRRVPVGAALPASVQSWRPGLEFLAAGEAAERIDFLGFDCYGWAAKSDFKVSGYENLVESFGRYPVPMFFSEYGTYVRPRAREFGEVECLLSSDMTGVFSGGFVVAYSCSRVKQKPVGDEMGSGSGPGETSVEDEESSDVSGDEFEGVLDDEEEVEEEDDVGGYDLMRVEEDGTRRPKKDFWNYKARLEAVAQKSDEEVFASHGRKDFENWRCGLAGPSRWWLADPADIPSFPWEWDEVLGAL
ncbi:hypothetical protein Q7P37_000777 [Cladosporium fusiforme]